MSHRAFSIVSASDTDALSDLDCDVDDLLDPHKADKSDDSTGRYEMESPYEIGNRFEYQAHEDGRGVEDARPNVPRRSVYRQSQKRVDDAEQRSRSNTLSSRRGQADLHVDAARSRIRTPSPDRTARPVPMAARDSLSPEPLFSKRRDRFGSVDTHEEDIDLTPRPQHRQIRQNRAIRVADEPAWSKFAAPILPLPLTHPGTASVDTDFQPDFQKTFPRGQSPFIGEQRGAYLRETNIFRASQLGVAASAPHIASAIASPQRTQPRPELRPRSLLCSDWSLGSFFEHEYGLEENAQAEKRLVSPPVERQAEAENAWHLRGDSPTFTTRVRSQSIGQEESNLVERQNALYKHYYGDSHCEWERSDVQKLQRMDGTDRCGAREFEFASSPFQGQSHGPFILSPGSGNGTPASERSNDFNDSAGMRAEEQRLVQQRNDAERYIAKLFETMDTARDQDIQRRVREGPQKKKGFFGIKASKERQAHFELAWDRLCGHISDDSYLATTASIEREGQSGGSSGGSDDSHSSRNKPSLMKSVKKKLFRRK